MTAQLASSTLLAYGPQGARQLATATLLSYSPPAGAQRVVASFSAPWAQSAPQAVETHAPMHHTEARDQPCRAPWGHGEAQQRATRFDWVLAGSIDRERSAPWQQFARRLQAQSAQPWVVSREADAQARAPWGEFAGRPALTAVAVWVRAVVSDPQSTAPWGQYEGRPALALRPTWATARRADAERWIPWSRFGRPLDAGWGVVTPPGGPPVDENGTVIVLAQRTYIVINEARLRRVDGDIQIPTFTMSMSLDADSWTWSFSASVPGYALPDIEPEDGVPVAVQATINGTPYRFIVESISRERTFGRSDLRIGGRGRAAVLDAPYAPIMSFGNEFGRTAQQIMIDILTDNGVPLGWDVEWNPDDWNVPAGVFNHQGSYISALNQVAGSISAYLQPHNTDEVLRVLSRYPVAPWDWAGVTPDFDLPAAVMSRESIEWRDKPRYNRVYVMGQQAGVNGRVTRAGTAGDYLAPSVVDPLITQAVAARQRGIAVLSDTGRIATVGLRLPVLAETGIIKPGSFVKYTDGGAQRIGITRSVQVEVGLPAIWQTLGVETHVEPI